VHKPRELVLVAQENRTLRIAEFYELLARQLELTAEQRSHRLPSGRQTTFYNRVNWAATYLRKAGLLSSPQRGWVEMTPRGKSALADAPTTIDNTYLAQFEAFRHFTGYTQQAPEASQEKRNGTSAQSLTPYEQIEQAHLELVADLRQDLIARVKQLEPSAFEGFVLRLLYEIGYGGSLDDIEGVIPILVACALDYGLRTSSIWELYPLVSVHPLLKLVSRLLKYKRTYPFTIHVVLLY